MIVDPADGRVPPQTEEGQASRGSTRRGQGADADQPTRTKTAACGIAASRAAFRT